MTEFDNLARALAEYNRVQAGVVNTNSDNSDNDTDIADKYCSHDNVINEKGVSVCIDCGQEMQVELTYNKEWRHQHAQNENKYASSTPSRIQSRKPEERNIYKDVENFGFSESIIFDANKIYIEVTHGKILRGESRRSVIFACIFYAYKLCGKPQSYERLMLTFNLDRKNALGGLKFVNLHAPKNFKIRTTYITPVNLIDEIMEQFRATEEQKKEVIDIYTRIKN